MSEHYMPTVSKNEQIDKALEIAWLYSQIDGNEHKAWVIDQMVRALCGREEVYNEFISEYTKKFVDERGYADWYNWNVGIAP